MSDTANTDASNNFDPPCELLPCAKAIRAISPADYGPIVIVEVDIGPTIRTFHVFKGLLTHYSTYFKTALQDRWTEGETSIVKLPDDDSDVFSAVFHWLFTQKLYFELAPDGSIPLSDRLICGVYVFGDARGMPDLCNAAIDLLFQKCVQIYMYPKSCLNYVWEHTMEGSVLRKFLTDFAAENYSWTTSTRLIHEYPVEFLLDIIVTSREQAGLPGSICQGKTQWTTKKKAELCAKYHDHTLSSA